MLYTTYFAKVGRLPRNVIPVSICAKPPFWWEGLQYKKLAPSYSILSEYKKKPDIELYTRRYDFEILSRIDFHRVLDDLQVMIPEWIKIQMKEPFWRSSDWHIALVCYEKPSDFCHRHIVADWFRKHGIECRELSNMK